MADQNVREIQLSGKQLVFMFMTATVAAVVIFLCGVMVGRGVNAQRTPALAGAGAGSAADPTVLDPTAPARSATDGTVADSASASSQDDVKNLTYAGRLEAPEPPPEPVEPAVETRPAVVAPKEPRAVAVPASRAVEPASREPGGDGFVVQVASLRSRAEADTVSQRLAAKGFPAFVTTPGSDGPRVYRVRVGKYPDRREAETVARRLEKEEQFKPWITR